MLLGGLMLFTLHVTQAFQWSTNPANGTTLYACHGRDVSLPWNFTLASGEKIEDMRWYHQGNSGTKMLANQIEDFFSLVPLYANKIQREINTRAGLMVKSLTEDDLGIYSIRVDTLDSRGRLTSFTRIATVITPELAQTSDNHLHAFMDPQAVQDAQGHWRVQLLCGPFTSIGQPPVSVAWTTPNGTRVSSSGYQDGFFNLLLSSTLEAGHYSCNINQTSPSATCLALDSSLLNGSQVLVNGLEARFLMVRSSEQALLVENYNLQQEVQSLKEGTTHLEAQVKEFHTYLLPELHACQAKVAELTADHSRTAIATTHTQLLSST